MFSDFCTDCGQALLDSAPTTSPYAYANNRPMVMVDPDGRKPWYKRASAFAKRHSTTWLRSSGWLRASRLPSSALRLQSLKRPGPPHSILGDACRGADSAPTSIRRCRAGWASPAVLRYEPP